MNPILRQRIPPSVRKLLTDIGPRNEHHCSEWTDTEPETVTRDGIELPARGTTNNSEFLTPATGKEDGDADHTDATTQSKVCGLCLCKPSYYTCPRCNVPYCGLECYRSTNHSVCSEEFYKESVLQELKDMGETECEGRKKMQDILLRLRHMADGAEGGMEGVLKTVEEEMGGIEGTKESAQVLELLSKLAEIQSSGEGNVEEIEEILTKLKELGDKDEEAGQVVSANFGDVDEGVEDAEELDLADRLSGLDIDALSEEALWDLLSSQEKEKFRSLVKGGAVGALVPLWRPWWEQHEEGEKALMEVLKEEMGEPEGDDAAGQGESRTRETVKTNKEGQGGSLRKEEGAGLSSCEKREAESQIVIIADNEVKDSGKRLESVGKSGKEQGQRKGKGKYRKEASKAKGPKSTPGVPPINVKIPPLSSLSSHPSPLVRHGLVDALFGYTFALRLFNGDIESDLIQEFCQMVLTVSEALSSGRVFSSLQETLEGGEAAILAGGYFDREDPSSPARAVEAVAHILTGRSKQDVIGYSLAALSQLCMVLSQARAALSKEGDEGDMRKKYFLAGKKCEFFQAWVSDNAQEVRRLAAGLWREHRKREDERSALQKEKRRVEESWKKGRGKAKGVLIQEID
ncbi:zinc finger HIT domain-containing protein 2 [Salmo salar]|uniref:Zinc finger HIT domain-containing protein 2 n=1 Tax=Salmo salar TaxID=8030 RepID=A0A1S3L1X8_SALSA|nr:zinc finger HIT domain-containing protein 2 [Salmo salar]|eukprot:XP_013984559.1 PREDICTED: zinc finger HIT domain-containing protein 2 [Salmo salar]